MRKVMWLKIFRGNEILYKADGTPSNENQIVKLLHGTLECSNYLKYLRGSGLCKVEVVRLQEQVGNEFRDIEIPDELREEVRLAHEGSDEVVLTDEQKRIKELEEKLNSLTEMMKIKSSPKEVVVEDVVEKSNGEVSLDDLKEMYKEKFGKKPFYSWDADKLKEKLDI
jgi:hypothetical protein